jgi:hypothetical protein
MLCQAMSWLERFGIAAAALSGTGLLGSVMNSALAGSVWMVGVGVGGGSSCGVIGGLRGRAGRYLPGV